MNRYNNKPNHSNLTKYNNTQNNRLASHDIHPISIKMLNQGNPWVTVDKYSEKFNPRDKFVVALNKGRPFALLLHDPTHKYVRARLWSKEGGYDKKVKSFKMDFQKRMHDAFASRKKLNLMEKRKNFYLLFGEGDQIPGLFVQYMNGEVLIQFYTHFWDKFEGFVLESIIKKFRDVFDINITKSQMWIQMRVDGEDTKEPARSLDPNTNFRDINITEYGVNYRVSLGRYYDTGIYTDMSAVREALTTEFTNAKRVLNLYSYTGAFSLFALKYGAEKVVSVDLSPKYIEWLEENISLNESFDKEAHTSMVTSATSALEKLVAKGEEFDLIICDPPSSSSNGKKRTNALKEYEKMIPLMNKVLSKNGKIVNFLNTHRVSKKKFSQKLLDISEEQKLGLRVGKFFGLKDDCPAMPKFAEGSYLKGFMMDKSGKANYSADDQKPRQEDKSTKIAKKSTKKVAKKITKKVAKTGSKKVYKKQAVKKSHD